MANSRYFFVSKILICIFVGALAATAARVVFSAFSIASALRNDNTYLIWFIAAITLITKIFYTKFRTSDQEGHQLIFESYKSSRLFWIGMAPLGIVAGFLSHLCGASVGREGSIVQLSAILADQIKKYFFKINVERTFILQQAISAGFAAALGAPLAGAAIGVELFKQKDDFMIRRNQFLYCLISAISAQKISYYFGLHHMQFALPSVLQFELIWIPWLIAASLCFGVIASLYIRIKILFLRFNASYLQSKMSLILAALLLSACLSLNFFAAYLGLGVDEIQASFLFIKPWYFPLLKILFTLWSLQLLKLKGGEFTPLVLIGSSSGSFLSSIILLPTGLLAALGFVSVYGAVNMVPISMAILASELFSFKIGVMSLLTAGLATKIAKAICSQKTQ